MRASDAGNVKRPGPRTTQDNADANAYLLQSVQVQMLYRSPGPPQGPANLVLRFISCSSCERSLLVNLLSLTAPPWGTKPGRAAVSHTAVGGKTGTPDGGYCELDHLLHRRRAQRCTREAPGPQWSLLISEENGIYTPLSPGFRRSAPVSTRVPLGMILTTTCAEVHAGVNFKTAGCRPGLSAWSALTSSPAAGSTLSGLPPGPQRSRIARGTSHARSPFAPCGPSYSPNSRTRR